MGIYMYMYMYMYTVHVYMYACLIVDIIPISYMYIMYMYVSLCIHACTLHMGFLKDKGSWEKFVSSKISMYAVLYMEPYTDACKL
jgi:hypothetical protein